MTILRANNQSFDVDCVVLDKDGTLLDFDYTWGRRTAGWIRALAAEIGDNDGFYERFAGTIGYDWKKQRVLADGPLAVTTGEKLATLAAGALYEHGIAWHDAERLAVQTMGQVIGAPLDQSEVRTVGDVKGAIHRLREAGVAVTLVTGDGRASTEAILPLLEIDDAVMITICGDDPVADKPDPAAVLQISERTGIPTARMLMVGDTANDMLTGRNAGVAGCIGIIGSTGDPARLAQFADVVLVSIDQLRVEQGKPE